MPFPVPGHYAQMQSNMAATLNIDWLLDVALDLLSSEGVARSRADLIRQLDESVLQAKPAAAATRRCAWADGGAISIAPTARGGSFPK